MITKALASILLMFVGLAVSIGTSILVCINGWGLVPHSWTWIIVLSLLGQVTGVVIIQIGTKLLKED
jgi:hypothetical protein